MDKYFGVKYEFDRSKVLDAVSRRIELPGADYLCAADGVVLNTSFRHDHYRECINGGMFCLCDSSWVPLYIRLIHGRRVQPYTGSEIFMDLIRSGRHRMIFLGASKEVLAGLRSRLSAVNPAVAHMCFHELPYCDVEHFDYPAIAELIRRDGADIIWIALGAPKQEQFMHRLKPHLDHGVIIAVGAVFKFFSGVAPSRAPGWMIRHRMEFVYRLIREPRKQIPRCLNILRTLPPMLLHEWKNR